MNGKLCFLICKALEKEAQTLIESEKFDDVVLVTFPDKCGLLDPVMMKNLLLDCQKKYDRVYLLGGCCVAGSQELEPYRSPRVSTCFHLLQSRNLIDKYLNQGCYLVTPGWLANWRRHLADWGFKRETARQFFSESASRLVLLDTGLGTKTDTEIQDFAKFLGLSCEILPVGLDFFHLLLKETVLKWRLGNAGAGTEAELAAYAMAVDLIGGLTRPITEREAIESVLDLFASLFAPGRMLYLPVHDGSAAGIRVRGRKIVNPSADKKRLAQFSGVSAWTKSGAGFIMRIGEQSDVLGILEIDKLAFPAKKEQYLNLALSLNNVCRMAIQNARTYEELEQAREALRVSGERARLLSEASSLLLASDTPESIVQTIATKVMTYLNCDCFFNYVFDENTGKLRLNAYAGVPARVARQIEWLDYGVAICGCVARDGARIVSEDVQHNGDERAAIVRSFGVQAYAAHPLGTAGMTIGTLSFGTRSRTTFTPEELDLMKTVADYVSVAMQRKRAEEALRSSEQRWATTLASIGDGVIATDGVGKITFMNAVAETLTGWTFREAANKPITEIFNIFNEHTREPAENPVSRVLRDGVVANLANHTVLKRKDGTEIPIDDSGAPIRHQNGVLIGVVLVFRDITERRKVDQLKDEFISMVSHEIKTPLTVIIGSLSTAADERVTPDQVRELLGDAMMYSEILGNLVDNLLELSRQQSNRLVLQTQVVDVTEITRNVIGKLQNKSALHRLVSDFAALTTSSMSADPLRVERIIYNLVDNAIKYSPNGGEVKVSTRQDGNCLVVSVSDQGPGISRDDQARLFQSFERLGVRTSRSIQGTGLGLRVCRILVEAHGGKIWVDSEEGRGSTFLFTLPVRR